MLRVAEVIVGPRAVRSAFDNYSGVGVTGYQKARTTSFARSYASHSRSLLDLCKTNLLTRHRSFPVVKQV